VIRMFDDFSVFFFGFLGLCFVFYVLCFGEVELELGIGADRDREKTTVL